MNVEVIKEKGKNDLFEEIPIEFIKGFGKMKFEEHTRIFWRLLALERSTKEKFVHKPRRCATRMIERKEYRKGSKGLAQVEWRGT